MADAIKGQFGITVEMIKGGGGIFDVVVDGNKIYSKDDTGRFPTNEEILDQLTA